MTSVRWVLVVLGNRDRSDDGAGPAVGDAVAVASSGGDVRIVEPDDDPGALLDALALAPRAVVVDAVRSGAPPGTVHHLGRDDRLPPAPAVSTHDFGLGSALGLARALGRLPADLTIYGIEGETFAPGHQLSTPVAAAVDRVVRDLLVLFGREVA